MKNINRKSLQRIIIKDDIAFKEIFNLYGSRIIIFLIKKVDSVEKINFLLCEIIEKIIDISSMYDFKTGNFDCFVFSIVKVYINNYYRDEEKDINKRIDIELLEKNINFASYNDNISIFSMFRDFTYFLDDIEYDIVVGKDIYNLNYIEISNSLEISKYQAKTIYNEAMLKIEEYFKNDCIIPLTIKK